MLDAPFFGRVDFAFEDEEEAERFYIGIGNFAERAGMTPLVYDWRARSADYFMIMIKVLPPMRPLPVKSEERS